MSERTTCAVIGGGPAGMVLGLLLARAGVEVTVLEKHKDFLRDFRGDTVHPSTLRLLDDLGLGTRFAELPQTKITEIAFPDEQGRQTVVGNLDHLRRFGHPYPYIAITPQWDFLTLLADAASEEPTFSLRMRSQVTELIRERGRVNGVRYRTEDGTTHTLLADLTVACDGRWSLAREQAGLRPKESSVPIDVWWFRLEREPGEGPDQLRPYLRGSKMCITVPRHGYYQMAYIARKGLDAELRARGIDAFRRDIAELVPELADRVGELTTMEQIKHLDVRLNRLDRWHRDGLLCLGDAAHAMSPIGGVGINLAVQDAVAAARLLARPLRRGKVDERTLAAVQRRRTMPTIVVQGLQRLLHRVIVAPVMEGRRSGPPKPLTKTLRTAPWLSAVPAFLIGVGPRPERAPTFARRR
ncbi:FAD-dependent oxidoreductase [Saccharomonospora xinjiangensis]|uniref:2-polyprenyl-6-methoxyphenol hydroxylase-like oxidoreductase n=1 Tax=Saccharomonospora xinjiangensis XJ-54 TaxID=882086 RepID=I0UZN4_9PSEU|nr:FAD-dependent oxidoreductase [Saccharomonospora xinjiangensis]EID53337.1 2-polyprenyl-6-methoxyphenol hydroxylase-like oxidoreductase [Saccharomonospora xinjiangensis XJ-54]